MMVERRDGHLLDSLILTQDRYHPLLDAAKEGRSRLDFERKRDLSGETLEDLSEGRDPLTGKALAEPATGIQPLELLEAQRMDRSPAIGGSVQRIIVNNDQLVIAADVQVQLDSVGFQLDRLFKGCHRILGRQRRGPSMRDVQRHSPPLDLTYHPAIGPLL